MTPSRIQLRLVAYQGQAMLHIWAQVQAHVHDPQALHQAQDLMLALPLSLADGTPTAVLAWSGVGWVLSNQSQRLYVYINEQALAPGLARHIDVDDVLDVGLSRFVVEAADWVWHQTTPAQSHHHTDATPLWDAMQAAASAPGMGDPLDAGDPFGLVPMTDLPPEPSDAHPSATASQSTGAPGQDTLSQLATAYLKALHDPRSALGQAGFDVREQEVDLGPSRDFEKEAQDNKQAISLEDVIHAPPNVATMLQWFYTPGEDELSKPEQHEDILWLFASDADRRGVAAHHALAPRTRQDHHSMTIDSSYHLSAPKPGSRGDVAP